MHDWDKCEVFACGPAITKYEKAAAKAEAEPAIAGAPIADNDAAANGDDSGDEPRRGWWQRTFG